MAAPCGGMFTKLLGFGTYYRWGVKSILPTLKLNETYQVRYAARKGTRERKQKKKKSTKVEPKKIAYIPPYLRGKDKLKIPTTSRRNEDFWKPVSTDNVWVAKYYKWRVYSFAEAVQCHRETHHPSIYNVPDAPLNVTIELDMRAAKKNKFVDNLNRMVHVPHTFEHGEDRSVLVFCKTPELQKLALEAGATLSGGAELIKDIQSGELPLQDFQYLLAHPNILPELVAVRGLMKRRFPNPKSGTLGADIAEMVSRFRYGITYSSSKDEQEQDYGWIDTSIGTINMEVPHLEDNLAAVLQDINSARPKREGPFITRCMLVCPPSVEKLKVPLEPYLEADEHQGGQSEEEEEEREEEKDMEETKKSSAATG